MPSVITSWLEQSPPQCVIEYGAYKSLKLQLLVQGLTQTDAGVLDEAIDYLASSGTATYNDTHVDFPNLRIASMSAQVMEGSPSKVVVDVEYRALSEMEGQGVLHGGANLQPVETQKDRLGNALTVSHTFSGDLEHPDGTDTVTATITVDKSSVIVNASRIYQTSAPFIIAANWAGFLNSREWQGGQAGQWKCIECRPEPLDLDASPQRWMLYFTFEFNPDYWRHEYIYQDSSGRIPAGIVEGVGTGVRVMNPSRDFHDGFPS